MSLLAASLLPREVRVCVQRGPDLAPLWIVGRFAPPPLWAALAVLTAGEDGEQTLRDVARAWLPWKLADRVEDLSDDALAHVLRCLVALTAGATDTERARAAKAQAQTEARGAEVVGTDSDRWDAVVSETAVALRMPLRDLLEMPWPAFLVLGRTLPAVKAAEQLQAIEAASVPHMKAGAQRQAVQRLQRIGRPETPATAAEREQARADAEHVRRQVEHFLETGSTLYEGAMPYDTSTTAEA